MKEKKKKKNRLREKNNVKKAKYSQNPEKGEDSSSKNITQTTSDEEGENCPLLNILPQELHDEIIKYMEVNSILKVSQTSKYFHKIITKIKIFG